MPRTWLFAVGVVLSAVMVAAEADELKVTITVKEPAGVARHAEPASGGIPFKKGQVKSVDQLALFDRSGKPVPAQFTKLAGYEDGSVQWALVDFRATVPANGTAEFAAKPRGAEAAPAGAGIKVDETADIVTVNTGVLEFSVNKAKFNLVESVKVNGVAVTGAPAAKAVRIATSQGNDFAAGAPDKVAWEYKGSERVTLRVDGAYRNEKGESFLFYTTRLTAWAGTTVLRIDHAVRNSDPPKGFDAKIKEAALTIPLAFTAQEQGKSYDWAAAGDGKVGVLLVNRNSGGCFPGESTYAGKRTEACYKQSLANGQLEVAVIPRSDAVPVPTTQKSILYGYDKERGYFALGDCAHKNSQITLDIYTGARDAAANAAREKALRSPLHALADPARISETETIGSGKFGTLADEIATYQKWGWKKWDDPKKQPHMPAQPRAYVAKEAIHWISEADSVEGLALMYIRTGERGFLDWTRAWADYGATHYAYRTDGFAFSLTRPSTALRIEWYGPKEYGWSDSRSEWCHFYDAGMFDYYCLTGEVDALEAGRDLVEETTAWAVKRYKPGSAIGTYGVRGFARGWLAAIRLAQLTRAPEDRQLADRFAEIAFKASDWDPRGFINWGAGPDYMATHQFAPKNILPHLKAYMGEHGLTLSPKGIMTAKDGASWPLCSDGGTWESVALQMAFDRYYRATGSEQAKALAVKMAVFARDFQFSKKCQQAYYYTILDIPEKGKVYEPADWDDEHKNCPGPGAKHQGGYTCFFPDVFARTYSLTGDKQWLDMAKTVWNRGSKRRWQTTEQAAPDDEVFVFATHIAPGTDSALSTARMFYEVPRAK